METLKFADSHNMVTFLSKPTESEGFEQIMDFLNAHLIKYALKINPTIYIACIEQFWSTVKAKTIKGEQQLHALMDGKKVIITKSIVRRDLQLEDEEGVDCLPNATIFEQLQEKVPRNHGVPGAKKPWGIQLLKLVNDIDEDEDITLVNVQDDDNKEMFDMDTLTGDEVFAEQEVAAKDVNLTVDEVTLAQALAALKSVKPKVKGDVIEEPSVPVSVVSASIKDKGKGILVEPKKPLKKKDQLKLDEECDNP
ncbi:hypothetical protein Tco_0784590 [Tanacetum coccineum]